MAERSSFGMSRVSSSASPAIIPSRPHRVALSSPPPPGGPRHY
jgi:hypothetical protein